MYRIEIGKITVNNKINRAQVRKKQKRTKLEKIDVYITNMWA